MLYSMYKNKKLLKELSDKDYILLKFNKVLNPFHTYLMYSLIKGRYYLYKIVLVIKGRYLKL